MGNTLDPDFLAWEYTLAARSDFLWSLASLPLVRAADSLWKRSEAARTLWDGIVTGDKESPLLAQASFSGEETEILNDYALDRVALMLLGLATENAAKTLIVRAQNETIVDDAKLHLKTHDLCWLLNEAGVQISAEEANQLVIIRDYVEWLGRYPVPLSAQGKSGPRSVEGAWVMQRLGDARQTWTAVRAVLERTIAKRDAIMFGVQAV